jgi:hypothetical protein
MNWSFSVRLLALSVREQGAAVVSRGFRTLVERLMAGGVVGRFMP